MPVGPLTTWEDLASLGRYKNDVYNILNAQRGYTMRGLDDIALNTGFAEKWSWYCYNVVKGSPYGDNPVINTVDESNVVWKYDNLQNSEPHIERWSEKWTETQSASIAVSQSASITLESSINIQGIAGSSFSASLSTESNKTETFERQYELSREWEITVNPGEILTIIRKKVITTGTQQYYVNYGLDSNGRIATDGKPYNGHYYWGYNANHYLNSPSGTMRLQGYRQDVAFSFELIRVRPGGRDSSGDEVVVEPLSLPTQALCLSDGQETLVEYAQGAGTEADDHD